MDDYENDVTVHITSQNLRDIVKYFTTKYKKYYDILLVHFWSGEKLYDEPWKVSNDSLIKILQLPWYFINVNDSSIYYNDDIHKVWRNFHMPYIFEISSLNKVKYVDMHMEYDNVNNPKLTWFDELREWECVCTDMNCEYCSITEKVSNIKYITFDTRYLSQYKKNILNNIHHDVMITTHRIRSR